MNRNKQFVLIQGISGFTLAPFWDWNCEWDWDWDFPIPHFQRPALNIWCRTAYAF